MVAPLRHDDSYQVLIHKAQSHSYCGSIDWVNSNPKHRRCAVSPKL